MILLQDSMQDSGAWLFAFFATYFYVIFTISIVYIIAEWKIYTKAGKPGWATLIPIYNVIVLLEIVGKPWYWILLLLIPGVNIVLGIWLMHQLSKSFGHGVGFTLGLIFLSFIFILILGFGDSKYVGPAAA